MPNISKIFLYFIWIFIGITATFLIGIILPDVLIEGGGLSEVSYLKMGFPFQFYKLCSGGFCIQNTRFNYFYFLIDFAIWLTLIYFIYALVKKSKKS